MEGVHAVITGADVRRIIPTPYYGPAFHDQPILAHRQGAPCRRAGGGGAGRRSRTSPRRRRSWSRSNTTSCPAVFDEVEAATSPVLVHEALKPAGTFADLKHLGGKRDTNVALEFQLRRGDVERAFAEADHVFEHTFRSRPGDAHAARADGRRWPRPSESAVTIHTASQSPSFVRMEIARLLGWPENRVRVRAAFLGGGFGAKLYIKLEALVAALALLARRPVKLSLTMEEQFYTITKHASTVPHQERGRPRRPHHRAASARCGGTAAPMPISGRASRRNRASPPPDPTTSRTSRSTRTRSTPTCRRRARCAASASRSWSGPTRARPTSSRARWASIPVAFRRKNVLRDGRPQATGTVMQRRGDRRRCWSGSRQRLRLEPAVRARRAGTMRRGRGIARRASRPRSRRRPRSRS